MIALPKRVAEDVASFTGRTWLLPRIEHWWKGGQQVLLVTGDPGTGKSMIMAWLAGFGPAPQGKDAAGQLARIRASVKAAHFCQATSRNTTPQAFAESMASQLATSMPAFDEALAATLAERAQINVRQRVGAVAAGGNVTGVRIDISGLTDEASFDRAFALPLRALFAKGNKSQPVLLLVDALDEAQPSLVDLLWRLDDLPGVRILATSRNEPSVRKYFRDKPTIDLITDAPDDVDDVRTYAAGRVAALRGVDAAGQAAFAERLAKQADGVFLYAAMVLDEILANAGNALPDLATHALPDGLSGLYAAFLNRELGKDETRWSQSYAPLLGILAVAQGEGLTAAQLTAIVGSDVSQPLRACKQYLSGEIKGGPLKPFHKSFADFLLDDPGNKDYHVDAASMHERIGRYHANAFAGMWDDCKDAYALRYTPLHLAQAIDGREATATDLVQSLVDVATDEGYLAKCEEALHDVALASANLSRAVIAASRVTTPSMLPALVRAARRSIGFRRSLLRGEAVVDLAQRGDIEKAEARLALFPDIENDWQVAALLIVAWLALDADRGKARELRDRIAPLLPRMMPLPILLARLDDALDATTTVPVDMAPGASIETARQIVLRISGQSFNQSFLRDRLIDQSELIEGRGYQATLDGPVLVNTARENGAEGTAFVDEYIDAHAGYNYVQYRNRSLWVVMHAVLRHHPDGQWVRDRLRKIVVAALSGGGVEFTETAPVVAAAQLAKATAGNYRPVIDDYRAQAFAAIDQLTARRGANDSWSLHKRRLLAIIEGNALAFADRNASDSTWSTLVDLEGRKILEGFAGFQAPAELRAADTLRTCVIGGGDAVRARLERALKSAHHVQDYHFCARVTARCNALIRWHGTVLDDNALQEAVADLCANPGDARFSADHLVGEPYRLRDVDNAPGQSLPIDPARDARTFRDLCEVFQRSQADFARLNPNFTQTEKLADKTPVHVPDPGLAPLLAVHLAGRILRANLAPKKRTQLIDMLVPAASANATALDSVLAYLLIAAAPLPTEVLTRVVQEIGPVELNAAAAPVGQIGPDAAIPA